MTMMPDVMAKTRICVGLDDALNGAADATLWDDWYWRLTTSGNGYTAETLLDKMGLEEAEGGTWDNGDVAHVKKHVLGTSGSTHRWWEPETLAVATEGFARAIWMMYNGLDEFERTDRIPIHFWWSCPATHVFRVILLENRIDIRDADSATSITAIISTPPKKDHPEHYDAYQDRLADGRLFPKRWRVPYLPEDEPLLIIANEQNTVKKGKQNRDVAVIWDHLTEEDKSANVMTAQPKCEDYNV